MLVVDGLFCGADEDGLTQGGIDTVGQHNGLLVVVKAGHHHHKLITTQAAQQITIPGNQPQAVRHLHQQLVAGIVAQGVVDALEIIQIQQQDGQASVPAACAGQLSLQRTLKAATVHQPGECIVLGQAAHLLQAVAQALFDLKTLACLHHHTGQMAAVHLVLEQKILRPRLQTFFGQAFILVAAQHHHCDPVISTATQGAQHLQTVVVRQSVVQQDGIKFLARRHLQASRSGLGVRHLAGHRTFAQDARDGVPVQLVIVNQQQREFRNHGYLCHYAINSTTRQ